LKRKMNKAKQLNLGKAGVTDAFIAQARTILVKYRTLKIKVLKSALDEEKTDTLAKDVAKRTNAQLDDVRGHTFTLSLK
jgi:RNA-binding protein YhbY